MLHTSNHSLHHGSRRFRNPVEYRYFVYQRPSVIWAKCLRCQCKLLFITEEIPSKVFNEESGGYSIQKGWVGGEIVGRGACVSCGLVQNSIQWPEAAFLQVTVREGVVWA